MKITFNTYGNDKQKLCAKYWIDDSVSDIVYGGSKGSAKSYTGCSLIFGDAFLYPGTMYFIARKRLNDIRKFTIPSIYEVFNHWGISQEMYKFNANDNVFVLNNGSKVFLIEAAYQPSDPMYERLGSMQMTRGWVEEAGEFEEIAKNNLLASVGRWKNEEYGINGKILQTCNPKKNYLYRDYYKKAKEGILEPHKRFIQALPEDNKKRPAGYIEHLQKVLSTNQKERLLYGNWEYDDDPDVLIDSYDKILDIFNSNQLPVGSLYITCDAARFGSDKARIFVWKGFAVIDRSYFDISKTTEISAKIKELQRVYKIPNSNTIVDADGVGGGVVDQVGCKGFVNNARPLPDPKTNKPSNHDNLKSQCGFMLADKINQGVVLWKVADTKDREQNEIIEELEQLKKKESDGKQGLIQKDVMKEKLGRSPDYLDTFLMRMYFELKPVSRGLRVL